MGACIKFGDYNANYKYIFLTCFFNYLTEFLFEDLKEIFILSGIIKENTKDLSRHAVISYIFNFLGIFIISFILYKFNIENHENINIIKNNSSEILLINNDIKDKKNIYISFLNLFFILSFWILLDHITRIIHPLMIFEYPMFELLFISFITSKILKIEIYIHQKIGIAINSLCCLILGILRFIYSREDESDYFYAKYKWFIPISIIIYIFIISTTSYIYAKLKFYMDLQFISHIKLLILYGIMGFVFSIIACIIETSFKCVGSETEFFCKVYSNIENSENNFYNHEIYENNRIHIYNENNINNNSRYIENFFIFIEDFLKLNSKEKLIEIVLIFFGTISSFCGLYFDILVIKYLTPIHFIFCNLIYLLMLGIEELILNIIIYSFEFKDLFNISPFICSFIGFLIYLEIIELNFCNLNYNLRKYINERSFEDIYEDSRNESINSISTIFDRQSSLANDSLEMPINKKINNIIKENNTPKN